MANFTTKPGVDWPAIRQRYDAGETLTSIAKDAGVTRQGIAERAKKEGWAKPDRPRRQQGQALASIAALPEPDSDRAKMAVLEALHMGSTLKAAAARAGMTVDQLKHWRNRDETFGRMCDAVRADFEIRNLKAMNEAAARDWRSADALLQRSEATRDAYNSTGKANGGPQIVVQINVPRGTPSNEAKVISGECDAPMLIEEMATAEA